MPPNICSAGVRFLIVPISPLTFTFLKNGEILINREDGKKILPKERVENICLKEEKKNGVGKGGKYPKKARLVQCSSCG